MGRTGRRTLRSTGLNEALVLRAALLALMILAASTAEAQISKLPHHGESGDFFGGSVAIDGDLAVVGAASEDVCGENSGASYIFRRSPESGMWALDARIVSSACEAGSLFGRSVAISDGVIVVAAGGEFFADDRSSAAHVFARDADDDWTETVRLVPRPGEFEGLFAAQVAIHAGRILVVTSGDRAGGRFQGAAHVYERDSGGAWHRSATLAPALARGNAVFGNRGAIHNDRVIVAASGRGDAGSGSVYIFEFDPTSTSWLQRARLDGFSAADLAVAITDSIAVVGDHGSRRGAGVAQLLTRRADGLWVRQQELTAAVSHQSGAYGSAVAVSTDRAVVVGFDEQLGVARNIDRVAFIFERDSAGRWNQRHVVDIGETHFGASVAFDGRDAILGSTGDEVAGAAYVVRIH